MKQVMLSVRGRQSYVGQDPDVIELVTEGELEQIPGGWVIRYEETELTGMQGVTTTFHIEGDTVTLNRTGRLNSQMVFREGVSHESLYQLEFGALLMSVCASRISVDLTENGGTVDLAYSIEIEQNAAGVIDYHLEINPK